MSSRAEHGLKKYLNLQVLRLKISLTCDYILLNCGVVLVLRKELSQIVLYRITDFVTVIVFIPSLNKMKTAF